MNKDFIRNTLLPILTNRRVVLLGLGKEGMSSIAFFERYFPEFELVLADRNSNTSIDAHISHHEFHFGDDYLDCIRNGDFIVKSPGISLKNIILPKDIILSSQTDLFLRLFSNQVIGVTGTKGKSTTSSLIYHILKNQLSSVFLVGNIGVPALEITESVKPDTWIVYEMSSHQLQYISKGPSRAVILNFHQEHLDHYLDYAGYREAKWQIAVNQSEGDYFVFNTDDNLLINDSQKIRIISNRLPVSLGDCEQAFACLNGEKIRIGTEELHFSRDKFILRGEHNIFNLLVSLTLTQSIGLDIDMALKSAYEFQGLEHRLEYVGVFHGNPFL